MDADLPMESFVKNLDEFEIKASQVGEACFRGRTWNWQLQFVTIRITKLNISLSFSTH